MASSRKVNTQIQIHFGQPEIFRAPSLPVFLQRALKQLSNFRPVTRLVPDFRQIVQDQREFTVFIIVLRRKLLPVLLGTLEQRPCGIVVLRPDVQVCEAALSTRDVGVVT